MIIYNEKYNIMELYIFLQVDNFTLLTDYSWVYGVDSLLTFSFVLIKSFAHRYLFTRTLLNVS